MNNSTLRSMTAYGRASQNNSLGRFAVEIQCLNRKFLEINISIPKEFLRFEMDIRKWISEKISRGQINVTINYRPDPSQAFALIPNLPLAKSLKNVWVNIASELNLKFSDETFLQLLAQEKEIIFAEELNKEDLFRGVLKELLEGALEKVFFMKKKEGEALSEDIFKRLNQLEWLITEIAEKSPQAAQKYYQKLKQRLEELFTLSPENEERVLREVAIFSEKIDISEEITRFRSHLKQFHHFLMSPVESPGKTLDFLIQEINREINTIGSKASDASISHLVVSIKSELEKIREQIQNIE